MLVTHKKIMTWLVVYVNQNCSCFEKWWDIWYVHVSGKNLITLISQSSKILNSLYYLLCSSIFPEELIDYIETNVLWEEGFSLNSYNNVCRMFYFFFESRNAKSDPVVIWLTGGPGCSSELALFYENGPFHLTSNLSLQWNDFGWDKVLEEPSSLLILFRIKQNFSNLF